MFLRRQRPEFSCEKLLRFIESFHHQSLRERPWSGFHHPLLLLSNHDGVCPNLSAVIGAGSGREKGVWSGGERRRKAEKGERQREDKERGKGLCV